jgi:hypothetical protein
MEPENPIESPEIQPSPAERPEPAGAGNVAALGARLSSDRSPVSEGAVSAHAEKDNAQRAAWSEYRDTDGQPFDSAIHVTNSDGSPALTKTDKLRKRPGRKAGATSAGIKSTVGKPGVSADGTDDNTANAEAQARAAGVAAAETLFTVGVALGGDEWKPQKDARTGQDEREFMRDAFGTYFEAKGMTDFTPGIALCVAVGAYAAPRLTMPKTIGRFERFKLWLATKAAERRSRKRGEKKDGANEGTRIERAEITAD